MANPILILCNQYGSPVPLPFEATTLGTGTAVRVETINEDNALTIRYPDGDRLVVPAGLVATWFDPPLRLLSEDALSAVASRGERRKPYGGEHWNYSKDGKH